MRKDSSGNVSSASIITIIKKPCPKDSLTVLVLTSMNRKEVLIFS